MRALSVFGAALFLVGAPLVAAPATVRYEADLQVIGTRKLGGQERQVIQFGRRIVELGDGFFRKTDDLGEAKTIMESNGKEVVRTTVKDGVTTIQKFDSAATNRELKRLFGDSDPASPGALANGLAKKFGIEVKFGDLKKIGTETVAGIECDITEYSVTVGEERQQVIRWQPKDRELRDAFEHLQYYSYRLVGEASVLQHAEVLRNIRTIRN